MTTAARATYVAFPSSPALRQSSRLVIRNLEAGVKESQTDLITRIMFDFTDELLKVFLLDIVEMANLSPFLEKLVHGTVNTIRGTVHTVTKAVVHKLDNRQLRPLADHIRKLMLTAPDASGNPVPWVGFAIEEAFEQRLRRLVAALKGEAPESQTQELIAALSEITDRAMDVYIIQPTELVGLGFILRKVADGGAGVVRSAVHALIRKLVPDLTAVQLRDLAEYMEQLLLVNPTLEPKSSFGAA